MRTIKMFLAAIYLVLLTYCLGAMTTGPITTWMQYISYGVSGVLMIWGIAQD